MRLSKSIAEIKPFYQIVVVGSGYGGGIAASRLSRAGRSVCVLERGREFVPGEFPDTEVEAIEEMQANLPIGQIGNDTGLYDFHVDEDINVFRGCGLGGTSLVNANVSLQADPRVFENPVWPKELLSDRSSRLAQGYLRAEEMLKPTPYPEDWPKLAKLQAHAQSAQRMKKPFYRTPLNVCFEDGVNQVGIEQNACTLCGDCITGCNYAAKNTVAMNYLPDSFKHGAEIFTELSVRSVEYKNDRWVVYYTPLGAGRDYFGGGSSASSELFVTAEIVVLAAGSLGSTEILLRSQSRGLALSSRIGQGFSGNADVLGFGYNNDREINGVGLGNLDPESRDPVGPCISSVIDVREGKAVKEGMIIEEGVLPGPLRGIYPKVFAWSAASIGRDTDQGVVDQLKESARQVESLIRGAYHGAVHNTQTYLVMSHDDAKGRMYLCDDRLRIAWTGVGEQAIFERINENLHEATEANGGTYVANPLWSNHLQKNLLTVHPLGGCNMAEVAERGVTNHLGQVFSCSTGNEVYAGLYVMDGSVIPTSLGVNPLLTISAIAERNVALLAESRNWSINYDFGAGAIQPTTNERVGIRFTEKMQGFVAETNSDDFSEAERIGRSNDSSCSFVLTISADDLAETFSDPRHAMKMMGTVEIPSLSAKPMVVSDGVFELFSPDQEQKCTKNLNYRMRMSSVDGDIYYFYGYKVIRDDPGFDLLKDTTTLFVTIYRGVDDTFPIVRRGILKITLPNFMRQLKTMQVTGAKSRTQRLATLVKFGKFFAGELFEIYGGFFVSKRQGSSANFGEARKRRSLRTPEPEVFKIVAPDQASCRLTRYRGGERGPVLLVHDVGQSSELFTWDIPELNFVEYMAENGFDLWLLDARGSLALDRNAKENMTSLDDWAQLDYRRAVKEVLYRSGHKQLDVVAVGWGAVAMNMAILGGLSGLRRVVIAQGGVFVSTDLEVREWTNQVLSAFVEQQLDAPMSSRLAELVGDISESMLDHMGQIVEQGRIVDRYGKSIYFEHPERMQRLSVYLLHGESNLLISPESSQKTAEWLANEANSSQVEQHFFPEMSHIDMFIGKDSVAKVFPTILQCLEDQAGHE